MAVSYLKDGEDFGTSHFPRDFGFAGSADGTGKGDHHPGRERDAANKSKPTRVKGHQGHHHSGHEGAPEGELYSKGGHVHPHGHKVVEVEHHEDGSVTHHHAHGGFSHHGVDGEVTHHDARGGMCHAHGGGIEGAREHRGRSAVKTHPHGHHVTHVEMLDGAEVHHHAHGGMTLHHDDGRVTHHHGDGAPVENFARGGDEAEDKAMIKKAFRQHDEQEHHGEHTDLHLRRGGMPMPGMGAAVMPHSTPRRQKIASTMPTPGGVPAGIPPAPDDEGPVPGLRHGGRARRHEG